MSPRRRLTYCTNVHPAESLREVRRALQDNTIPIKARFSPDEAFNVGLRLSARAARELLIPGELERFQDDLDAAGLFVTSLNGFPYGDFHGTRVKEAVYRPDWHEPERLAYTLDLFHVLAELLPEGETGSVSTVPGCFQGRFTQESEGELTRALHAAVARLVHVERTTGKRMVLALEPEPACFLETSELAKRFFEDRLLAGQSLSVLSGALGQSLPDAERAVRRHLGVCLDACHASVEHETPLSAYRTFIGAGLVVGKIQVSAGLALSEPDQVALQELARYDEPTYLHQTVVAREGTLRRYVDLGEAIAAEPASGEWRVHFHVPVFRADLGAFGSTQGDLSELLATLDEHTAPLLEVETYTWGVLPQELRARSLVDAIAEELEWTRSHVGSEKSAKDSS